MTKYIGRLLNLGIGREVSRGVGVAPSFLIPRVSFSVDDKVIKVRETAGLGSIADTDDALVTTKYSAGDLETEMRDKSFGIFLYALLGACSTSGPTDSAYTHSFSIAETNTHQSLSLLVSDPNTKELYKLSMIDSLELNLGLDDVARFSVAFMGKKGDASTFTQSTATAENKFTKKHLSFKVASNIAGLAAATGVSLKSLKLIVNKNVVLDDVLGTAEPEDINNRQFSVEGELVLNYTDEVWKNYMRNNTSMAVEIKLTNTDALIGSGTRPTFTIQMPKVDFFNWEPDYALDNIVSQKFSFKANRDVANSLAQISTCTLVNAQASY